MQCMHTERHSVHLWVQSLCKEANSRSQKASISDIFKLLAQECPDLHINLCRWKVSRLPGQNLPNPAESAGQDSSTDLVRWADVVTAPCSTAIGSTTVSEVQIRTWMVGPLGPLGILRNLIARYTCVQACITHPCCQPSIPTCKR